MSMSITKEIFTFNNQQIRTFGTIEEPWFCGKDIAIILGYKDTTKSITNHVDEDDKLNFETLLNNTKQGRGESAVPLILNQNDLKTIYINESGLYSLIFSSKLEIAKIFKKWITSEVLPNIRKKGKYEMEEKYQLLLQAKEEIIKKKDLESKYLYFATQHDVDFHIRDNKEDALYLGGHITDLQNYIRKLGKGTINRAINHNVSTIELNKFKIEKVYRTYKDLALPTEQFLHSLLEPLMIKTNKYKREHFLSHHFIIDKITTITLNSIDQCVREINEYILLLKSRNFIYDEIEDKNEEQIKENINEYNEVKEKENIKEDNEHEIKENIEEKICTQCNELLPITNFYTGKSNCRKCLNLKRQERRNKTNIYIKKICENCKNIKEHEQFYKNKKEQDGYMNICKECFLKLYPLQKQCTKCLIIKNLSEFYKDKCHKDGYDTQCKVCNHNYVNCNICNKLVLLNNLERHQKSKKCQKLNLKQN